ncbi:Nif11-like leader peptide family RiPP precursor [Fusibacter ferrireducens]|uniref:Nif11-like leader peptide family RiPP n=1 Tax=Fusibacter ferrireducens TaxID=2785058 RepID=A0ABR9ZQ57_9FIRM|nr:Nif11-like leader peptide family RiPP precursor [Fusibacter ferrireducens]MBF4692600.1 Nif11-like leader peptide family RiPP precursor [Fusibacter ferrireducens]
MEAIKKFNEAVLGNPEMLEEIKALGNDVEKIVAYANAKGYKFTVADLEKQNEGNSELSEEQLDEVVGGLSCVITGVVAAAFVL